MLDARSNGLRPDIRDHEINQTVLEQHAHKLRTLALWTYELDGGEDENNEVEAHGVDECGSKNSGVRLGYRAALAWYPFCREENT